MQKIRRAVPKVTDATLARLKDLYPYLQDFVNIPIIDSVEVAEEQVQTKFLEDFPEAEIQEITLVHNTTAGYVFDITTTDEVSS